MGNASLVFCISSVIECCCRSTLCVCHSSTVLSCHRIPTRAQTDLEAQLHSARTRLARESAARRDEVDLLNGRIIAHQQSLEASERSLGETLDERSKMMRLLSESETQCQALAAQVDQLRKSLTEAGDLEVTIQSSYAN
jgi:chromosome segregation ATPase